MNESNDNYYYYYYLYFIINKIISIDMLYHYIAILPVGHFIMKRSKKKNSNL